MFERLNEIREKQEQLAQLHFKQDLQQDMRRYLITLIDIIINISTYLFK